MFWLTLMFLGLPDPCWAEYWPCWTAAWERHQACLEASGCDMARESEPCDITRQNCTRRGEWPTVSRSHAAMMDCLEGPGEPAEWNRTTILTDYIQQVSWAIVEAGGGSDGILRPECEHYDDDRDGDVDLADFARLQRYPPGNWRR